MRLVIIESPFAGPSDEIIARNVRYVRACMRDCLLRGEAPFASHALYTLPGVLNDRVPEERKRGMEAGWTWMRIADPDVLVAVYANFGVSPGMEQGIDRARAANREITMRLLNADWDKGHE